VVDTITIDKEKLMNVWACLVMDDIEQAYHQLYTAWNDREDANPFNAFSDWWTDDEMDAALKRMRELIGEPEEKRTAVQRDGEGL